ncbi:anosmin-1 [Grammomys surdaster]|uniref:anosmin-1 n=1 Tax=Grammomys surdaster TaxID=491861 RepID=UPI00109F408F|nr:anosmin-1 [Grammomys surdaster]
MQRMTPRLHVCAAAAVWAWLAAVGVASPGGRGPGAELSGGAVLGARCAARCLGLHVKSAEGRGQDGVVSDALLWCQNDRRCLQCLAPCRDPEERPQPCNSFCEARSNLGLDPIKDGTSAWETVAQTALPRALLPAPRPGRWFQFRVAAHGSRGFTAPSRHFLSTRDPAAPPAPANLRVVRVVGHSDGSVSVEIAWAPDSEPDVPPHHFRVTWGGAGGKARRRMTLDATQHSVVLPQLRPGDYAMQLQAVAFWGEKRLLGARAELQFSAAPAPDGVAMTSDFPPPDNAITEG